MDCFPSKCMGCELHSKLERFMDVMCLDYKTFKALMEYEKIKYDLITEVQV